MNARQFVEAFNAKMAEVQPSGFWGDWSRGMYRVLEEIGKEAGFEVRDENHRYGEINQIDFAYLPKGGLYRQPPTVVIEHENIYKIQETLKDFWKLCLYAVPLRVMIGYKGKKAEALEVGRELTNRYQKWNFRQLSNGETLLIMGWSQYEAEPFLWHYWLLKGDQDAWIEKAAK